MGTSGQQPGGRVSSAADGPAPTPSHPNPLSEGEGERRLGLFEAFGVELEYMIVARDSLDVRPIADELLRAAAGEIVGDFERGPITWSNELAAHVIEMKTTAPAADLAPLAGQFAENVREMNRLLAPLNARLMPTAMHPWMDPHRETRLWAHEFSEVYEAYNRVFGCQGHGWSNLQSVHLNLPFNGDEEFGRLHAAIRLLLPILPALAASSPIADGRASGFLDTRLEMYRHNSRKVPSLTGRVIPEPVFTEEEYREKIFERMYADIAPHDSSGVLRGEFLNSRGAIARFDRGSIEIRVLDIQECPAADMAIVIAIVETLRALVEERWMSYEEQKKFNVEMLEPIFLDTIRAGGDAVIQGRGYLRAFGRNSETAKASDVWRSAISGMSSPTLPPIHAILRHGALAQRILHAIGSADSGEIDRTTLAVVYRDLCECLEENRMLQTK